MFEDTYKTITGISEGLYKEKGSRFIAIAIPVEHEMEVKEHIMLLKKKYHDARHHCYAYILGYNKTAYRMNDDGEPSGTAGRPIYGQLLSKDLTNVLIVVIRYFGGIKLGVSGLINAYKTAAKDALEKATIVEKTIYETYEVFCPYIQLNSVMQLLKGDSVRILEQTYDESYRIKFSIKMREADRMVVMLKKIEGTAVNVCME